LHSLPRSWRCWDALGVRPSLIPSRRPPSAHSPSARSAIRARHDRTGIRPTARRWHRVRRRRARHGRRYSPRAWAAAGTW
jgi:hypothetical protein